mmetsp:Transcript_9090/g.13411  ORF Transcript_9090/g.13411 Transcript_9090/m.13411 type:complete len:86 (-) Transcript_9090:9-266(-)
MPRLPSSRLVPAINHSTSLLAVRNFFFNPSDTLFNFNMGSPAETMGFIGISWDFAGFFCSKSRDFSGFLIFCPCPQAGVVDLLLY